MIAFGLLATMQYTQAPKHCCVSLPEQRRREGGVLPRSHQDDNPFVEPDTPELLKSSRTSNSLAAEAALHSMTVSIDTQAKSHVRRRHLRPPNLSWSIAQAEPKKTFFSSLVHRVEQSETRTQASGGSSSTLLFLEKRPWVHAHVLAARI